MQIPTRRKICLWFIEEIISTSRAKSFLASGDDFRIFIATRLPSGRIPLYTLLHSPFPIKFPEIISEIYNENMLKKEKKLYTTSTYCEGKNLRKNLKLQLSNPRN